MAEKEWFTRSTGPGLGPAPVEVTEGGRVLTGHFAVFNEWTRITGDPGYEPFMERVAPGAFRKTFRQNGDRIRLLLNHGQDPQLGTRPIAQITQLAEDGVGAFYAADLLDGLPAMVVDGIRRGLYGSSFSFRPIREHYDPRPKKSDYNPKGIPERTVLEAAVREFGPTPWGAYAGATSSLRVAASEQRVVAAPVELPPKITRVNVTASAYAELVAARLADGLETGGALLGRREDDVLIVESFYEDAFAERFAGEVAISNRHLVAAAHTDRLAGSWHSHPSGRSAVPEPSDGDIRAWRSRARDFGPVCGLPEWLAIIAGPSKPLWAMPEPVVTTPARWRAPVLSAHVATPLGVERVPVRVLDADRAATTTPIQPTWRLTAV